MGQLYKSLVFIICMGLLLISGSLTSVQAQSSNANIWYFGIQIGLDFSTSPPTLLRGGNTLGAGYNVESSTSVTDANGNLLFVTTGAAIYNGNLALQPTTLSTTLDAAQGNLVFPRPGTTDQYYLCTVDAVNTGTCGGIADAGSDRGARFRTVTTLAGGAINVGAESTTPGTSAECQVGAPKNNGTDYWWIFHERGTNNFKVYSVTNGGITLSNTYAVGPAFTACTYTSMLQVNGCYNKIAMAAGGQVTVFDFNNTTGAITNAQTWTVAAAYGLEFSPNGNYLFVSQGAQAGDPQGILQYDITSGVAATISGTVSNLGTSYGALGKSGHLQLGPDGKIYVAQMSSNSAANYPHYIGAIMNPNVKPATFNQTYITVSDQGPNQQAVTMGLPTFLKSFLSEAPPDVNFSLPNYQDTLYVCVGQSFTSSFTSTNGVSTVLWDFGDGATSGSLNPSHSYAAGGTYTITLTVTDVCGRQQQAIRKAIVPTYTTTGTITCGSTSITLDGTGTNPTKYRWFANSSGQNFLGAGDPVTLDYTGNLGAAPSSVWVQDFSYSKAMGTLGPMSLPAGDGTANTVTNLAITAPCFMTSLDLRRDAPCTPASTVTITLSGAASATYVYSWPASCGTATIPVNFRFPAAGAYTLTLSATGGALFSANKYGAYNPPATLSGVGTNNGAAAGNSGPFYKMVFVSLPPCAPLVQVNRSCSLPVEFVSFTAQTLDQNVILSWVTATETNNNYFTVERSLDGITFNEIAIVSAGKNPNSTQHYSYLDRNVNSGIIYYRIKQTDVDGNFIYTEIKSVSNNTDIEISILPNPNNGNFKVKLSGIKDDTELLLIDPIGKILIRQIVSSERNEIIEFNLPQLTKGIYYLQAGNNSKKLVIE